jgi:hypothetical protein
MATPRMKAWAIANDANVIAKNHDSLDDEIDENT